MKTVFDHACQDGHPEIGFRDPPCPLCEIIGEIEKMVALLKSEILKVNRSTERIENEQNLVPIEDLHPSLIRYRES